MPNAPSTMRRRLAIQDEAIERLEHSVQAYQDERARLEARTSSSCRIWAVLNSRRHEPAGRASRKHPK